MFIKENLIIPKSEINLEEEKNPSLEVNTLVEC